VPILCQEALMKTTTVTPRPDVRDDDELSIRAWRTDQLRRLGVPRALAYAFGARVDWHEVAALVERGCAPELALEIVR
jgi:hypothetical protein